MLDEDLLGRALERQLGRPAAGQERKFAQLPVSLPDGEELTAAASRSKAVGQLRAFADWLGPKGRALTSAGVRFPTIIITAHDEPEARARCLAAGVAAYLCKPLHDEMLLDAIANVIGRVGASAATEDRPRA